MRSCGIGRPNKVDAADNHEPRTLLFHGSSPGIMPAADLVTFGSNSATHRMKPFLQVSSLPVIAGVVALFGTRAESYIGWLYLLSLSGLVSYSIGLRSLVSHRSWFLFGSAVAVGVACLALSLVPIYRHSIPDEEGFRHHWHCFWGLTHVH